MSAPLVLVADDDPDILELLKLGLSLEGLEVVTARDGDEALEHALRRRPTLAVLDVNMPKVDGCELTRRLRAHPETRGMQIVLLTAYAEERWAALSRAAGADAYVTKPFSPRELGAAVRALLARDRGAAAGS